MNNLKLIWTKKIRCSFFWLHEHIEHFLTNRVLLPLCHHWFPIVLSAKCLSILSHIYLMIISIVNNIIMSPAYIIELTGYIHISQDYIYLNMRWFGGCVNVISNWVYLKEQRTRAELHQDQNRRWKKWGCVSSKRYVYQYEWHANNDDDCKIKQARMTYSIEFTD
jgi:hypothetical protein